jgi:hypothetical protein
MSKGIAGSFTAPSRFSSAWIAFKKGITDAFPKSSLILQKPALERRREILCRKKPDKPLQIRSYI